MNSLRAFTRAVSPCIADCKRLIRFPALIQAALLLGVSVTSLTLQASELSEAEKAKAQVAALSFASPFKIPPSAIQGQIRYRFAIPSGASWQFPETGEQHVSISGNTVTLDICRTCGQELPPSAEALALATHFNAYVDDAPGIRRLERKRNRSVDRTMNALVTAVQARMNGEINFVGYATASQAYAKRSGDCTEVAVLLASAARSHGIPVRVVYGWLYSSRFSGLKHHFSPHMWVQAWNGQRWVSYDAGVGAFDAGHIALGVGSGLPSEYAKAVAMQPRLKLLDMAGIRPTNNQP